MWTETRVSRGERFIGKKCLWRVKGVRTGTAFRLGCRHGTREGGEAREGRLGMNSLRLQLFQGGPNHPLEESCISQECASICMVTVYSRWREHPVANMSSMVMNPVGQWLRPSCRLWVSPLLEIPSHTFAWHHSEFLKVRYTYSFNAAPVNVQYLKEYGLVFQRRGSQYFLWTNSRLFFPGPNLWKQSS